MDPIDIVIFVVIILALIGIMILLNRSETRAKNKHKIAAYNLLEEKNPDPKKIKDTIRLLRLYGGRFRKDQEFVQLITMLTDLLNQIEKTDTSSKINFKK
jgi:Tfp pilus assembly protein PilV